MNNTFNNNTFNNNTFNNNNTLKLNMIIKNLSKCYNKDQRYLRKMDKIVEFKLHKINYIIEINKYNTI